MRQPSLCVLVMQFAALTYLHIHIQANKSDEEQPLIADTLQAFDLSTAADVCVIGCGPAGLALSSELAKHGLSVCLIGGLQMLCHMPLLVITQDLSQSQAHRM